MTFPTPVDGVRETDTERAASDFYDNTPVTFLLYSAEYCYGFFCSFAEPGLAAPGGWAGWGLLPVAGFDGEGVGNVILPLTLIEFDLSSLAAGVSGPTSSIVTLFDELGPMAASAEHPSSKSSRSFE